VDEHVATDRDAIKDSFGALRDIEVPARGPGAREKHLARVWDRSS
jgi:hypothetical protein